MTRTRRAANWPAIGAHLRTAPGLWHHLPEGHATVNPTRLRDGLYRHLPAGHFEARRAPEGRMQMRYVGHPLHEDRPRGLDDLTGDERIAAMREHALRRDAAMFEFARDPATAPRRIPELGGIVTFAIPKAGTASGDLVLEPVDPEPTEGVVVVREAGRGSWPDVAARCKAAPKVWHRILGRWSGHANPITTGRLVAFRPAGAFEARVRDYVLEVRYLGTGEEAGDA